MSFSFWWGDRPQSHASERTAPKVLHCKQNDPTPGFGPNLMHLSTPELLILEAGATPPPGTRTPPRRPAWSDTLAYIANPDQFCRRNLQIYGPIFQTSVFGGTTVLVGSARANQMVFNGDSHYTEIALPATTMTMFGEYSLFQRPDLHRQRKSALSPGLTGRVLEGYLPQMHQVIHRGLQSWPTSGRLALFPAVEQICFNLLVPLLLGVRLEETQSFAGLPLSSQAELKTLYKTFFAGFYGLLPWRSPFTAFGRGLKARAVLIELMRAVIQRRRQDGNAIAPTSDFLAMMLAGQQADPEGIFSDALIENQCLLQLWASHYEISGLVASLLYQLGRYPQWLEPLRQEQRAIAPDHDQEFSSAQLKQMVVLEAVIKETLRTLPPSSTATRQLTQSVVLDGVFYAQGWKLIAEPRIAHLLPEHFASPDTFDPQRFLERGEGKLYEFIPFGGGVHGCLGAQLAMVVTKVFAAQVLRQFDWQLTGPARFVQFPLKKIKDDYRIEVKVWE